MNENNPIAQMLKHDMKSGEDGERDLLSIEKNNPDSLDLEDDRGEADVEDVPLVVQSPSDDTEDED